MSTRSADSNAIRVLQDGRVVLAEIAGEHQLALLLAFAHPQLDARGAEDVPRIAHPHRDARQQLALRVVGHGLRAGAAWSRRPRGRTAARASPAPLAIGALRIAHRKVRRIAQQDGHQVRAGLVGVDRPAKAALHQQRQAAAMIDVRVAQDHGVDGRRHRTETAGDCAPARLAALDHAAVQQQLAARHPQDVAGTRHFSRGSEKLQLHAGHTLTSLHPEHSGARHERPSHPRVSTAALSSLRRRRRCHRRRPGSRHPLRETGAKPRRRRRRPHAARPMPSCAWRRTTPSRSSSASRRWARASTPASRWRWPKSST